MEYDPVTNLPWGTSPFKVTSSETYTPFAALDTTPFPAFVMDPQLTPAPFDASFPPYTSHSPSYHPSASDFSPRRPSLSTLPSLGSSDSAGSAGSMALPTPETADTRRADVKDGGWFAALQEEFLSSMADDAGRIFAGPTTYRSPSPARVPSPMSAAAELELERLLMGSPGDLFSMHSPPRPAPVPSPVHVHQHRPAVHPELQPFLTTPDSVHPAIARRVSELAMPVSPRVEPGQRSATNPLPGVGMPVPMPVTPVRSTMPAMATGMPPTPDPTPARKIKPLPKRKPSVGLGVANNLRRGSFSREGAWTRRRSSAKSSAPALQPAAAAANSRRPSTGAPPVSFVPAPPMPGMPQGLSAELSYRPAPFPVQQAPLYVSHQPTIDRSMLFGHHQIGRMGQVPLLEVTESSPALPSGVHHAATHHGVVLAPDDYHLLNELDPLSLHPQAGMGPAPMAQQQQQEVGWRPQFAPRPISFEEQFYHPPPAQPMAYHHHPHLMAPAAPMMEQSRSAPIPQRQLSRQELEFMAMMGGGHQPVTHLHQQPMPGPLRRGSSVDSGPSLHLQHLPLGAPPLMHPGVMYDQAPPVAYDGVRRPPPLRMDLIPPHQDLYGIRSAPAAPHIPLPHHHHHHPMDPVAGRPIRPLPSRAGSRTPMSEAGPPPSSPTRSTSLGLAPPQPPVTPHAYPRRRVVTAGPGLPTPSFSPSPLPSPTTPTGRLIRTPSSTLLSPPTSPIRLVSGPSRYAAAKSATQKSGGKVAQGPGNSMFINFTSRDSQKLLKGVAPSGSSKRRRAEGGPASGGSEDDLALLEQAKKAAATGSDRKRVVTA